MRIHINSHAVISSINTKVMNYIWLIKGSGERIHILNMKVCMNYWILSRRGMDCWRFYGKLFTEVKFCFTEGLVLEFCSIRVQRY